MNDASSAAGGGLLASHLLEEPHCSAVEIGAVRCPVLLGGDPPGRLIATDPAHAVVKLQRMAVSGLPAASLIAELRRSVYRVRAASLLLGFSVAVRVRRL